jgi:uncharacterized protein (DUF305 family)
MNKFLSVSLIIVFFVAGIGVGFSMSPAYYSYSPQNHSDNLGVADKYIDLRYINAMIAHHKGAIELAEQLQQNTQRTELQDLATEIIKSEPVAIAELYQWKKEWYGDTQEIEAGYVANLGDYDEKFDLRFLNALIAHHSEGIKMTKDIRTKSSRNAVLDNADAVEQFLNNGIIMLSDWRKQWYNI